MNAAILIFSCFCFAAGFSGFVLSILLFLKYRNNILLLYAVFIGAWSLNLFIIRILDILQLQFWDIQEMDSLVTAILAHGSWGIFTFFLILLLTKISEKRLHRGLREGLIFSSLFLMIPVEVVLPQIQTISILQYAQTLVHFAILYYAAFLLKKRVSSINKKKIRDTYKKMVNLLLILYPLLFIDLIPFVLSRFPFGLGIYPLFYFLVNLFSLSFLSNFIYFPKLRRKEEKGQVELNLYSLTVREREIAELLLNGKSYKEISEKLFIAHETVKTHVSNIYHKTQVSNKMELVKALRK